MLMEFSAAGTKIRTWMNVKTGETRIRVNTSEDQWKPSLKEVYDIILLLLKHCKNHEEEQTLMTMDGGPKIKYDFNTTVCEPGSCYCEEGYVPEAIFTPEDDKFFQGMPDDVHVGYYEQKAKAHTDERPPLEKGELPLQKFIDRFGLGEDGSFWRLNYALSTFAVGISFENPETDALNNVLTVKEASDAWGLAPSTLVSACKGQKGGKPKFTEKECRQSGKTWLITKGAMQRVYGASIDARIAALEDRLYKMESKVGYSSHSEEERKAAEHDVQKLKDEIKELMELDVVKNNPDKMATINRFKEDIQLLISAFIEQIKLDSMNDQTEVSEEEETK